MSSSWPPTPTDVSPPPATAATVPEQHLHAHPIKMEGASLAAVAAAAVHEPRPSFPWDNSSEAEIWEHEQKIYRYQAILAARLKAKYFSSKAFDGGDVFEEEIMIENEIIKASRWPCTSSFADPAKLLKEKNNSEKNNPPSPADPSTPSLAAEASAKNSANSLTAENSLTPGKRQPSKKIS